MADFVRTEVADGVAVVTLDRPPVNAIIHQVFDELIETFESFNDRVEVRVAILTGAGDRAFCAGIDLRHVDDPAPGYASARSRGARDTLYSIYECAVPVICALNGPALGIGVGFAAICDVIIASERGVFGLPEIDVGQLAGSKYLARLVGHPKARMMLLTAERVSAQEVYRLGGVERVVPHDRLMAEARQLAAVMAQKSRQALRLAKYTLNQEEFASFYDSYRLELALNNYVSDTDEGRQARQAFFERRRRR